MEERDTCLSCGKDGLAVFFRMPAVPVVANVLHPTREDAIRCPKGDIVLAFCPSCGFISNLEFDPSKLVYGEGYENPLHYSEVFKTYARRLAEDLVRKFDLRGKKIVEVGCGDGQFLRLLCDIGDNRGIGFDPSYPALLPTRFDRIEIIRDSYSSSYADLRPDFVCIRHTLEHIHDPKHLLGPLRDALGKRPDVPVYIEVPNASHTLRNRFVWDIIYEHPSYFTGFSLPHVVAQSGLDATNVYDAFSGQYLCVEARPRGAAAPSPPEAPQAAATTAREDSARDARREIEAFSAGHRETIAAWENRLSALEREGKNVALWGAGSKGITFLNLLVVDKAVQFVVDLNPNKQGKFIPGSGHEIVAPARLVHAHPDIVVVANPAYRAEIEKILAAMGLKPEVVSF